MEPGIEATACTCELLYVDVIISVFKLFLDLLNSTNHPKRIEWFNKRTYNVTFTTMNTFSL